MTTWRLRARCVAFRARVPAACLTLLCGGISISCDGVEGPAGQIEGPRISQKAIDERVQRAITQDMARSVSAEKQILFGDLHVHTTYSVDALIYSLPLFSGEGAHPPADACDFARHCAGLDFFSINDHAEGLTPDLWRQTKESIRQCNEVASTNGDPDMVSFVGWEWTQTGSSPETHFGHKNVIYPGLADNELPTRPITSLADRGAHGARVGLPEWGGRRCAGRAIAASSLAGSQRAGVAQ